MQIINLLKNETQPLIPTPIVEGPISDYPIEVEFTLYDQLIPSVSKEGQLFIPKIFLSDGTDWSIWYDPILSWIRSGQQASLQERWIVGSAKNDLTNTPRSAHSHANGTAIDITPIWGDTELVDPDGANPALAWNLASLAALSHYHSDQLSWVVEGDHIHLSNAGQPLLKEQGVVAVFTSLSSAYPLHTLTSSSDALKPLINKVYGFKITDDSVTFGRLTSDADLFNYIGE